MCRRGDAVALAVLDGGGVGHAGMTEVVNDDVGMDDVFGTYGGYRDMEERPVPAYPPRGCDRSS